MNDLGMNIEHAPDIWRVARPLSAHSGQRVSKTSLPARARFQTPYFTKGTLIKTNEGEVKAEDIALGMRVLTRDSGYQPVTWAGSRVLRPSDLKGRPHLNPIRLRKGCLGSGVPERDLIVSPEHRLLLSNVQIRRWFNTDEVLIAAKYLTFIEGIEEADVHELHDVHYVHFMFDRHEIVMAEGCWFESFRPYDLKTGAMSKAHSTEILELFPELECGAQAYLPARATVDPLVTPEAMAHLVDEWT